MASTDSIMNQIFTEAREGESLGCIDRCTTAELIEAREQFPKQLSPDQKLDKIIRCNDLVNHPRQSGRAIRSLMAR